MRALCLVAFYTLFVLKYCRFSVFAEILFERLLGLAAAFLRLVQNTARQL